jgi:hypothetical protein
MPLLPRHRGGVRLDEASILRALALLEGVRGFPCAPHPVIAVKNVVAAAKSEADKTSESSEKPGILIDVADQKRGSFGSEPNARGFFQPIDVPRFTIWIVSERAVRHIPLKHATKPMMTDTSAADYRSPTSGLISAFFQAASNSLELLPPRRSDSS